MGTKLKDTVSFNLGKISTSSFNKTLESKEKFMEDVPQELRPSTKITMEVSFELLEHIRDYAHWEGMTQKETVLYALENFFETNKVQCRPEAVKQREVIRMRQDKRRIRGGISLYNNSNKN
jgi:hypothetical protein